MFINERFRQFKLHFKMELLVIYVNAAFIKTNSAQQES